MQVNEHFLKIWLRHSLIYLFSKKVLVYLHMCIFCSNFVRFLKNNNGKRNFNSHRGRSDKHHSTVHTHYTAKKW